MNKVILLEQLKLFTEEATKDIIMPTSVQKGDTEQGYRSAEVHRMRLPDSSQAKKKAPYIIHQALTGKDVQPQGQNLASSATVRTIFCVYNADEEEGGLMLLNLMERLRIRLLKEIVIGSQFILDTEAGIEAIAYPDDTAPYYAGEMVSTWKIPAVQREVSI